jgi:hypothetical protein
MIAQINQFTLSPAVGAAPPSHGNGLVRCLVAIGELLRPWRDQRRALDQVAKLNEARLRDSGVDGRALAEQMRV